VRKIQSKVRLFIILICFTPFSILGIEEPVALKLKEGHLEGTLVYPESKGKHTVVLIIAGSGATDRDGNQGDNEPNSLKYISDVLLQHGIASLRFDKRGVGQSTGAGDESEMRLEDMVADVKGWINLLAKDKRFNRIIIAGHSEGSLIGMLAGKKNRKVKAFVSIAGAGRPADEVIREQLSQLPENMKVILFPMMDALKRGDTIGNVPPIYYALLRPSVQPYLISWFRYDPAKEIAALKIPVLILQGGTDLQVSETDGRLLSSACPRAKYLVIPDMNHVLKVCTETDKKKQKNYYTDASYALHPGLGEALCEFIGK
jgi:uncharacterized protein